MGRYTFWILLVACLLAAGVVYALKVRQTAMDVEQRIASLDEAVGRARKSSQDAVGPAMLETLQTRQESATRDVKKVRGFFATRDADNLDRWFEGLGDWFKLPIREEFQRHYNLGVDQLVRDSLGELEKNGVTETRLHLIEYPWMGTGDLPAKKELRKLQKEFWVQDRIVRALVRHGAVPTRPVRGGESQNAVRAGASGAYFDRVRYDVQVRCAPERLLGVIHAFDTPFKTRINGTLEDMSLTALVDNVSVRRLNIDNSMANRHPVEPPVEVSFFLTVLDFQEKRAR